MYLFPLMCVKVLELAPLPQGWAYYLSSIYISGNPLLFNMGTQLHIYFLRRVQCSFICTFEKHKKSHEQYKTPASSEMNDNETWMSRLLYHAPAMFNIKLHCTHTALGWYTHSHNTGLIRNNISLKYSHMSWHGGGYHMGAWLNQKQYIIKGITHGMGLHLVLNKYVFVLLQKKKKKRCYSIR